jgi:hypothetical protein
MKKLIILLIIIWSLIIVDSLSAVSINNRDGRPHDIQVIGIRDGKRGILTIYNNSTAYVDCRYGCQLIVIETGYTKTLGPETSRAGMSASKALVILNGKLK